MVIHDENARAEACFKTPKKEAVIEKLPYRIEQIYTKRRLPWASEYFLLGMIEEGVNNQASAQNSKEGGIANDTKTMAYR